jgi:ABC-type multidrug transport system permease subunit
MRFIFLSALKDLRRMRRDPLALAAWIGTPILVALLMVAFFGREQPKPQGIVLISDQDKTFLSALVIHAYTQDKLGEIFTVQQVPLQEGQRRIYSGDGSALVIIPKGFSKAVLGTGKATVQLITNPSQSILPGIVESVTSVLVEGAWRLQLLLGDDLRQFSSEKEPSDAEIAASSLRYRHLSSDLQKYLNPPLIKVKVEAVELNPGRRQLNIAQAMFLSMTFLSVLFLAFGLASDIWKEKTGGTLRHVAMTPGSISGFLTGKLLTLWIVYAALGVVALLAGKYLVGAEIHGAVFAVLWIAAFGGAVYMFLLNLNTFFSSPRPATTLSNLLILLMCMLGGAFFPFNLMPDSLAKIGRCMPNGWALLRFRDILAGQSDAIGLAAAFGAVLGVTAILFAAATWRLRSKFLI